MRIGNLRSFYWLIYGIGDALFEADCAVYIPEHAEDNSEAPANFDIDHFRRRKNEQRASENLAELWKLIDAQGVCLAPTPTLDCVLAAREVLRQLDAEDDPLLFKALFTREERKREAQEVEA